MAVLDERNIHSNEKADIAVAGAWEVPANAPQIVKAIQRYHKEGEGICGA
jgi:hypothetical protein